jgi:hypothetical protein
LAPSHAGESYWSSSRAFPRKGEGFIDEDRPPGVDEPLMGSPSFAVATYVRAILLACDQSLFLSVTPILRKKRLIIEVSALAPRSAERRSQRT